MEIRDGERHKKISANMFIEKNDFLPRPLEELIAKGRIGL